MKYSKLALALIPSVYAFSPMKGEVAKNVKTSQSSTVASELEIEKPLRDPFGLYPKDAPERQAGLIQPLEDRPSRYDDAVRDPMNLYKNKDDVNENVSMSASLPFLKQPAMLDGSLPGDRGFDPFNFSSNERSLEWYRNAEIKHARLAMLAAVGWPLAELFNKNLANTFDMKSLLVFQDRVPSVLNGGLTKISPIYWAAVLATAALIESVGIIRENDAKKAGLDFIPGDLGFDPLGLFGKTKADRNYKLEAELFNGRLAMLAITGFAIQEWWTQMSVVNAMPIFFKPMNVALEQLMDASAHIA